MSRKPTAGRYRNRAELEYFVRLFYSMPGMAIVNVAKVCGVSVTTVNKILNQKA